MYAKPIDFPTHTYSQQQPLRLELSVLLILFNVKNTVDENKHKQILIDDLRKSKNMISFLPTLLDFQNIFSIFAGYYDTENRPKMYESSSQKRSRVE